MTMLKSGGERGLQRSGFENGLTPQGPTGETQQAPIYAHELCGLFPTSSFVISYFSTKR